jgi:hypothetical protein
MEVLNEMRSSSDETRARPAEPGQDLTTSAKPHDQRRPIQRGTKITAVSFLGLTVWIPIRARIRSQPATVPLGL